MKREREKNIRSGEPVQNIINVNIWVVFTFLTLI